jgi:hypothetical protein
MEEKVVLMFTESSQPGHILSPVISVIPGFGSMLPQQFSEFKDLEIIHSYVIGEAMY